MYIPNIKIKPIRIEIPDEDYSACLVSYQWPAEDEWKDTDDPLDRFNTNSVDCTEVDKCVGCVLLVENLDIDYLVDKGYITKANALDLTLSGIDKN